MSASRSSIPTRTISKGADILKLVQPILEHRSDMVIGGRYEARANPETLEIFCVDVLRQ